MEILPSSIPFHVSRIGFPRTGVSVLFSDSGSPALFFRFLFGSGASDSFLHFRFSGFGFPVQLPGSGLRFWLFRFSCLGFEIWQLKNQYDHHRYPP